MRILNITAAVALALASSASAAVAAIPTGENSPVVIERPNIVERNAQACIKDGWIPPHCSSAISVQFEYTAAATAHTRSHFIVKTVDLAAVDLVTPIITAKAEKPLPCNHVGCVIASSAHSIACSNAGLDNAYCQAKATAFQNDNWVGIIHRDLAGPTTTRWTTVQSTRTVGSTTTTVFAKPSFMPWNHPPGPGFPWMGNFVTTSTVTDPTYGVSDVLTTVVETLHAISDGTPTSVIKSTYYAPTTYMTGSSSSDVTKPTYAVTTVETTVIKTLTHTSSKATTTSSVNTLSSTASPQTTIATTSTTCTDTVSIDTQSYLNISTWSMTGYTYSPISSSGNSSTYFTTSSTTIKTQSAGRTTASTMPGAASTDDTMGFTGAVTSTLNSAVGKSNMEFCGVQIPIAVAGAMMACFALALLL